MSALFLIQFPVMWILGGSRWWLKSLGLRHPFGRPKLSSELPIWAWPGPDPAVKGNQGVDQCIEDICLSSPSKYKLYLCVCLCMYVRVVTQWLKHHLFCQHLILECCSESCYPTFPANLPEKVGGRRWPNYLGPNYPCGIPGQNLWLLALAWS